MTQVCHELITCRNTPVNINTMVKIIGQRTIDFCQRQVIFSSDLVGAQAHTFIPNHDILHGDTPPDNTRLAAGILLDFTSAQRKIKDTKNALDASLDAAQQLQRLVSKRFLTATPYAQLQHFPRYLKAITARLEKWRSDPARDAARMLELKPQEQRYWRLVAERKGATDARMQEFRWLLEELRVSFFAQELRTPQPVSIKRLEKVWQQLNS